MVLAFLVNFFFFFFGGGGGVRKKLIYEDFGSKFGPDLSQTWVKVVISTISASVL